MFLFSAALFSACIASDLIIQKTIKETNPDFMIINGNLSKINEKQKIIMNVSQLEKQAAVDIDWKEIYIPLKDLIRSQDIYRRNFKRNNQINLDSFAISRRHNARAPLVNHTVQSTEEARNDKLSDHPDKRNRVDELENFVLLKKHNEPLIITTNSTQELKEDQNRVLKSGQEHAKYEPMVLSLFTRAPSIEPNVGLNNESISAENSLVSRSEPENYETSPVTRQNRIKLETGNDKPSQETHNEPKNLLQASSELKLVSRHELQSTDFPKYALFVNYDLLYPSNKTELYSNENTATPPAPKRYEQNPITYEPVKNRHQFQPETISYFKPAPITNVNPNLVSIHEPDPDEPVKNHYQLQPVTVLQFEAGSISTENSIMTQNFGLEPSDIYLPPLVSSFAIAPYQTPHRLTNDETKPYLNHKSAPKPISDHQPIENYESATYFSNQAEINTNPELNLSTYKSFIFEPQPMLNYEPDNLQPFNYDAPFNYEPVINEERPYEPRNYELQNYESSLFANNKPQTYERLPPKQLAYNYSHQSHIDNLRNDGDVEILDDEREAQMLEALNKQRVIMEKLADVIQSENRRAVKLSRGEKRFNELLNEIEEWNNKTSTTPKQKSKNTTKIRQVTPSIISVVDETEIRNALKENPLVKRILKSAARKRKEYLDAAKKYYNITSF